MKSFHILAAALAVAVSTAPAFAQDKPTAAPANAPAVNAQAAPQMSAAGEWRSSKLIGLNVYNEQNEKVGDISEVLLDKSGKVSSVVIGVGGFLGMGQRDVLVKFDQIKFINEPVRTTATNINRPVTTGGPLNANTPKSTTAVTLTRNVNEKWYPDHAVINMNKDQLKALPEFKYS